MARLGARGSGQGSAGERGSRSKRAAVPPRDSVERPRGVCVRWGRRRARGRGPGPPPRPSQGRPQPHAPYSAWLPRSTPCAALPAPVSAPARVPALAPLPLAFRFPLGCRCALARASRGALLSATACSACRGGAGRGPAEPTRGPRSPAEAAAAAAASRCRPGPALPQPRPALRRPLAAAHATAARSRRPAPRLRGLNSAWPPPGSFLSWREAAEGEGRAAPLCALPARHPHSGRRGARPGGREKLGGQRASQTCEDRRTGVCRV